MSEYVYAGLTSQTIDVAFLDSSSTTGAGLAGVVWNAAGISASYRKGATGARTAITLATQTVGGAYSSGGLVLIDDTNMIGVCRFDLPNAMVDTEGFVTLYIHGATNMAPLKLRIDCRPVPSNVKQISDDETAADTLELQYDGTGLSGDTYPSRQDQIASSPQLLQSTTIATLASQVSFTLTAGSADNQAYAGATVIVTDASTSTQKAVGVIKLTAGYVGATKTVTLNADPGIFTMATGDTIDILAITRDLSATLAGPGGTASPHTIESPSGTPLSGADAWMTTDVGGTLTIAGPLVSDASGLVTFMLDAGTYYLWVQKAGHNFTNPTTVTIS